MSSTKKRNSSFELLRIISMFMIVIHHFTYHGTLWSQYMPDHWQFNAAGAFLVLLGKTGVDIFVMIGAYFLVDKKFKFRRPVSLILTTLLYSFTIFFILFYNYPELLKPVHMNLTKVMLPFPLPNGYWFVNSYVLMLICMPFLNKIINSFSQRRVKQFLFVLILLWSIVPTVVAIFPTKPDFSVDSIGVSGGGFFIMLYLIGGYIRRYDEKISTSWSSLFFLAVLIISIAIVVLGSQSKASFRGVMIVAILYNPLSLILAISIFLLFTQFSFYNGIINFISGSMFGVYLIHDNTFLRPFIWKKVIVASKYITLNKFLPDAILGSLKVFVVCVILDVIFRRLVFGWPIKIITKWISNLLEKIFN